MDDSGIIRALARDFSVGTEEFRERLLRECLDVLGEDGEVGIPLDDDALDMLAAAGSLEASLGEETHLGKGTSELG